MKVNPCADPLYRLRAVGRCLPVRWCLCCLLPSSVFGFARSPDAFILCVLEVCSRCALSGSESSVLQLGSWPAQAGGQQPQLCLRVRAKEGPCWDAPASLGMRGEAGGHSLWWRSQSCILRPGVTGGISLLV